MKRHIAPLALALVACAWIGNAQAFALGPNVTPDYGTNKWGSTSDLFRSKQGATRHKTQAGKTTQKTTTGQTGRKTSQTAAPAQTTQKTTTGRNTGKTPAPPPTATTTRAQWRDDYSYQTGQNQFSYTHDIGNEGFNPDTDTVDSYMLALYAWDKSGTRISEKFNIDKNAKAQTITFAPPKLGISLKGKINVTDRGRLSVDVVYKDSKSGRIHLASSLFAKGVKMMVPEPAMLWLLAAGLVGVAGASRLRPRRGPALLATAAH